MAWLQRRGAAVARVPAHERGIALMDVVCAMGLLGVLGAMSVPSLDAWLDRDRARLSARYLAAVLHHARMEALKRNVHVAVQFGTEEDGYPFSLIADGNGNGVLASDIDAGVDVPIAAADRLANHFRTVSLRVVDDVPAVESGEVIARGSDPLRIGRSSLVSFSPLGTCTSGTIFVAGDVQPQAAVRLLGGTGRLRVLWFDRASRSWQSD